MHQTNNDEAVFIEVTSREEPLDRLNNKRQKFDEAGIEYDRIVQIVPGAHTEMFSLGSGVVSVGGWMIRGLESDGSKEDVKETIESVSLD